MGDILHLIQVIRFIKITKCYFFIRFNFWSGTGALFHDEMKYSEILKYLNISHGNIHKNNYTSKHTLLIHNTTVSIYILRILTSASFLCLDTHNVVLLITNLTIYYIISESLSILRCRNNIDKDQESVLYSPFHHI